MTSLVRYMAADPTVCGTASVLIDKTIRTTDVPCGMWCSFADFRGWRAATRAVIDQVLAGRPDLPPAKRAQLAELATEVAQMPESWQGNSERTERLAKIYEFVSCLATWRPDQQLPADPAEKPESSTSTDLFGNVKNLMWLALAILLVSKMGGRR